MSSGRAGAGASSKSDAVAIDMDYFPEVPRVRCPALAEGLDLAASGLGSAMIFDRAGGVSSHQPSRSSRCGSRGRRTGKGMIFAMGPTMPGRLAARLPDPLRICGFLCRFCADGGGGSPEPRLAGKRPCRDGIAIPVNPAMSSACRDAEDRARIPAAAKKKLGEKTDDLYHYLCRVRRRQERTGDVHDPRDLVAADSVPGAGLFRGLSRPRQSRLRRADHERRTEFLADDLRLGRRHFLHRLFHVRSAEQRRPAQRSARAAGSRASW